MVGAASLFQDQKWLFQMKMKWIGSAQFSHHLWELIAEEPAIGCFECCTSGHLWIWVFLIEHKSLGGFFLKKEADEYKSHCIEWIITTFHWVYCLRKKGGVFSLLCILNIFFCCFFSPSLISFAFLILLFWVHLCLTLFLLKTRLLLKNKYVLRVHRRGSKNCFSKTLSFR